MKKKIISIVAIALGTAVLIILNGGINLLGRSSTAFAVGDLEVDWGVPSGNPIFVVTNILPGDSEQRDVKITNNASNSLPIGVRGIQTSVNPANFPDALQFVIMEGVTTIYGPVSLTQFFSDSSGPDGIPLSSLGPGDTKNYSFKVTFDEVSGNQFQEAQIIFDLIIGIAIGIPEECQDIEFAGDPIFGTENSDNITGTPGNDLIFALEGHDKVEGNLGDDCIVGGDGHDQLHGNNDKDILIGGEGNDDLDGGNEDDKLLGNSGDDNLSGGNGSDRLEAHDGKDNLDGGNGDDYLDGGLGHQDFGDGKAGTDTCLNLESQLNCEI